MHRVTTNNDAIAHDARIMVRSFRQIFWEKS